MTQNNDARVTKEEKRLMSIYETIEPNRKSVIAGLIRRAAFMRVSLDDLEKELSTGGFTEDFQQGAQGPFKRERPAAKIYISLNTGYQKIIKQLTDLLPKETPQEELSEFDLF